MTRITIDDDMVERAARAVFGQSSLEQGSFWGIANPRAAFRMALEAALDRRTGPKDRRVEQDDTCDWSRRMSNFGQRDDDKCWADPPRKSARLKREAEEQKAQEMGGQRFNIGDDAWIHTGGKNNPLVRGKVVHIFSLPGWAYRHHYVVEIDTPVDPMLYVRDDFSMSDDANKPVGFWRVVKEAHAMRLQEMKERGQ